MDLVPAPSRLSQLIHDLTQREGEDLQRALDASTAILAGLSRRERASDARVDVATRARAERELERLVGEELVRLCELAARSEPAFLAESDFEPEAVPEARGASRTTLAAARRRFARRLEDELDAAEDLDFLAPSLRERIRDLAWQLRDGERDAFALRAAAAEIERRLEDARREVPVRSRRFASHLRRP